MNSEKAEVILKLVNGEELKSALSTVAIALIHICKSYGIEKQHMLDSIGGQWDMYEKTWNAHLKKNSN